MSLFDINDLIEIKLYYKYIEVKGTKKIAVIPDDKAEEILEKQVKDAPEQDVSEKIETIITQWSNLNWREQNNIASRSVREVGLRGEKQFDLVIYRDLIVKSCLKNWDLVDGNGNPVPVTPEAIDALPGNIVMELYYKYDYIIGYSEEELKN